MAAFFKANKQSETISPSFLSAKVLGRYVKKNALFAIVAAVLGLWALQIVFSYLSELDSLSDTYTTSEALSTFGTMASSRSSETTMSAVPAMALTFSAALSPSPALRTIWVA